MFFIRVFLERNARSEAQSGIAIRARHPPNIRFWTEQSLLRQHRPQSHRIIHHKTPILEPGCCIKTGRHSLIRPRVQGARSSTRKWLCNLGTLREPGLALGREVPSPPSVPTGAGDVSRIGQTLGGRTKGTEDYVVSLSPG